MAYAVRGDVLAVYEQTIVDRICYDKTSSSVLYSKLDAGLANAATEIDSYVSTRYPIPVSPTPPILKQINIDLGLYYVALSADKLFDQLQMRADHWRAHLLLIAKGQAGLGVPSDPTSPTDASTPGTGTLNGAFARARRV